MAYLTLLKETLQAFKETDPEVHQKILDSVVFLSHGGMLNCILRDSEERFLSASEPEGVSGEALQQHAAQHRAIRELIHELKTLVEEG